LNNPSDDIAKKYFSIGEVAEMMQVAPSLIRFWEKEFEQLSPQKSEGGTRKYSHQDIEVLKQIYFLVKQKGYTIQGAKEALQSQARTTETLRLIERMQALKAFLEKLRKEI
jgi:DNA-binding transcriptional MerR regulator